MEEAEEAEERWRGRRACDTPNCKSALSFSERAGRSTSTLGRLHPLRDPSLTELTILHESSPLAASTFSTWLGQGLGLGLGVRG